MIDERALETAFEILGTAIHKGETGKYPEDDWRICRRVIEAYEAAKWRPIEEMPEDRSKIVIWYGNALYHGEDFAVVRNAMFRTIEPPPSK